MADPSPRKHTVSRVFELRTIQKQIGGQLRESVALRELIRGLPEDHLKDVSVDREIFQMEWNGTVGRGFTLWVFCPDKFSYTFAMKEIPTTLKMPFAKVVARELLARDVEPDKIHGILAHVFLLDLGMLQSMFRIHNGEVTSS